MAKEMIGQVITNSALFAKVHAMKGKSLASADYDIMMNMKSVPAVAAYLVENTSYKSALDGVVVASIHRTTLEQLLRDNVRRDARRLMPFMSDNGRKFMSIISLEEGISKLKVCLRLINMGHPEQAIDYLEDISDIIGENLPMVRSVDDMIIALAGTSYYEPLKYFVGKPDKQTPFYMEMALDTYWAKLVYKLAKKYLSDAEKKAVTRIYGTEFDLQNLSFLLRCKKTFDMTDEEIYACVIPEYYRLSEAVISEIVKTASYEDAIEVIRTKTPYGNAFSKDDRFIERRQTEYLRKLNKHIFSSSGYSIQAPICYIHLMKIEINNIVSIIEGIRYGLDPEKIAGYLIGYVKGGKLS